MQPIVNGLEAEFQGQFAFVRRDAATPEGSAELSYYGLRGHPSYTIVSPDGRVLWSGFGPMPAEVLRQHLEKYAVP